MEIIWYPSPNYSYGSGTKRMGTLHTSEGATHGADLAAFCAKSSSKVSYNGCVDNYSRGVAWQMVSPDNSSWSQAYYNSVAHTYCFCTPGGASNTWSREYWLNTQMVALENMAAIVGQTSRASGIPLRELSNNEAQGSGWGWCQHGNLGPDGSNHVDCGIGRFPMDVLLSMAAGRPPEPEPVPPANLYMEDVFMGTVPSDHPLTVPVPEGAEKLVLTAHPEHDDTNHVIVSVWRYKSGSGWTSQADMDCSAGYPVQEVSVAGYKSVEMVVRNQDHAGYGFA